jgi:hypothetical protein
MPRTLVRGAVDKLQAAGRHEEHFPRNRVGADIHPPLLHAYEYVFRPVVPYSDLEPPLGRTASCAPFNIQENRRTYEQRCTDSG